jgi:tetratricopeptide (TPR) repeat protein
MQASKIRIALTWAALAGFLLVVLRTVDSGTPFVFAFVSAVLLSTVIVGVARARRAMARIQELMVLGEPDKMLALVRRKLRYAKRGSPNHAAFTVFLATGLSMKGDWDSALSALDDIDPDSVPDGDRALWQFGYYNARFACLVFSERLDEARAVLADNLEPLVEKGALTNAATALEACQAVMWFCDDEHDRAMKVFARLVIETPIPAPSRAVFHYFLARIYHARGVWKGANEHFDEAARLAPKTWVHAGVEAFRESKKLAP